MQITRQIIVTFLASLDYVKGLYFIRLILTDRTPLVNQKNEKHVILLIIK